jgi:hypothetical protein
MPRSLHLIRTEDHAVLHTLSERMLYTDRTEMARAENGLAIEVLEPGEYDARD